MEGCTAVSGPDATATATAAEGPHTAASLPTCGRVPAPSRGLLWNGTETALPAGPGQLAAGRSGCHSQGGP